MKDPESYNGSILLSLHLHNQKWNTWSLLVSKILNHNCLWIPTASLGPTFKFIIQEVIYDKKGFACFNFFNKLNALFSFTFSYRLAEDNENLKFFFFEHFFQTYVYQYSFVWCKCECAVKTQRNARVLNDSERWSCTKWSPIGKRIRWKNIKQFEISQIWYDYLKILYQILSDFESSLNMMHKKWKTTHEHRN